MDSNKNLVTAILVELGSDSCILMLAKMNKKPMNSFFNKYPWLFGYGISPICYAVTCAVGGSFHSAVFAPLLFLFGLKFLPYNNWFGNLFAAMYYFHFIRRGLEVLFINQYKGVETPEARDSAVEFVYYFSWGVLNGLANTRSAQQHYGCPPLGLVIFGTILFFVGQIWNFYCHYVLRNLRPANATHYVIPTAFPFNYIITPHYFFELLTWFGFAMASGFTSSSVLIFVMSLVILIPWANKRRAKYITMYNNELNQHQLNNTPNPQYRWVIIPFIY